MKKHDRKSHIARLAVIVMSVIAALLACGLWVSCEMIPPEEIDGPAPHSNPDDPENPAYVNPDTYTVTYVANRDLTSGSAPVDETEYSEGDTVSILDNVDMVADGWTFVGWYFADEPAEYYYGEDTFTMPAEDVTLYGYWTQDTTYHVAYDANGGNGAPQDANNYLEGAEASVLGPGTMTRDGYVFLYWGCTELVEGEEYTEGELFTMPAEDITFTAVWAPDLITLLFPGGSADHDQFGWSVAIDGDYAVVGMPGNAADYTDIYGKAFVFHRTDMNTWESVYELSNGLSEIDARFGYSVAISGDYIIVGAPNQNTGAADSGGAYVFKRTGNTETPNIWASYTLLSQAAPEIDAYFGYSVDIADNPDSEDDYIVYAVVGAPSCNYNSTNSGAAYFFGLSKSTETWTAGADRCPTECVENAAFGASVAVYGTYAIIGAPGDTGDSITNSGAAYVYLNGGGNGWGSYSQLLSADDSPANSSFGNSVDIITVDSNTGYAAVGAKYQEADMQGAAQVFKRINLGWNTGTVLYSPTPSTTGQYGQSVALTLTTTGGVTDTALAVGAACEDIDAERQNWGAAYRYTASANWQLQDSVIPDSLSSNDFFGFSVGISGDYIIGGAYGDDGAGTNYGVAYIRLIH